VGEDTTLAKIIALVEDANASKAPIARLADKISGIFVPVVIGIALLATVGWLVTGASFEFALGMGITVLVISCPCALGLATPVAIMVGTGRGAEQGILIKSAEALEVFHHVDTVVMDKTGTLTEGKPRVTDVFLGSAASEEELLSIAQTLEKNSEHPLAIAILEHAKEKGIPFGEISGFNAVAGRGVEGIIGGREYAAGNEKFISGKGVSTGEVAAISRRFAEEGKTPLYFAGDGTLLGVIAVADVAKPTSRQAVERFKKIGTKVVMLTGDNRRTAEAVRRKLGIDEVIAEVLPQEKDQKIQELQKEGQKVAMIGDGVNDAPALARADVGIAIGAGTDVAIEAADVVLIKNDLLDAVGAMELSRATIRNIKQNLFWAFFYNSLGIPLAAGILYPSFGIKLTPMMGAAAMSLSSFFVVANSLRLRNFKPEPGTKGQIRDGNRAIFAAAPEVEQILEEQGKGKNTGGGEMEKEMLVKGMTCVNCKRHVEEALNALAGVSAQVNLAEASVRLSLAAPVDDETLKGAVEEAGYEVTSIKEV
jgi:Cu+-exporting ATPase